MQNEVVRRWAAPGSIEDLHSQALAEDAARELAGATPEQIDRDVDAAFEALFPKPLRSYDETVADAREYLADAAAADTHSSDVDPGRVDPWEER